MVRVSTVLRVKKTDDELKKLRSEFTYLLIQDLKNTISVIKGSFELALKNRFGELSEEQRVILDIAETAINNHIKLLDEYLELSRLEFKVEQITKGEVEVDKIIHDVIKKFGDEVSYKNFKITLFDASHIRINADSKKLFRVFELLLGAIYNAGGRNVEISVKGNDSGCIIKIWDKNTKINPEEVDYLFDRYKQAMIQKLPRYKDLGLTICRIIVEAHNGKIWAEPEGKNGTIFYISFPTD